MFLGSHRKWLRSFQSFLLSEATKTIEHNAPQGHRDESRNDMKQIERSCIDSLGTKPAWAISAREAEILKDREDLDLIDFANSLDYEEEIKDVDDMIHQNQISYSMNFEKENDHLFNQNELMPTTTPQIDHQSTDGVSVKISPRIFTFDSSSNIKHAKKNVPEAIENNEEFVSDKPKTERLIIISEDVIRNRHGYINSFSNMPYLRLCPFV